MVCRPLIALAIVFAATGAAWGAPQNPPSPAPVDIRGYVPPHVWIFCGTPGDQEHHMLYEKLLGRFRNVLTKRFGITPSDLTVLYGPVDAGYDGVCTREALLAQLHKVVAQTQMEHAAPVWLIFIGHANPFPGGAFYNLPGPDISAHDLGDALRGANPATPMVVFFTTACSAAFLRPLACPGRIVVSATSMSDPENETEYPNALIDALESPETDTNHDGFTSVTELFLACHARVLAAYKRNDLMVMEHSLLDGTGSGHGSQRPSPADAEPASRIGLRITSEHKFD